MKSFGSILDFTAQRNRDILRACHEQLAAAKYIVMPEIFELAALSPAARFWVSEERAAIVISRMSLGKPLPKMRAPKLEMFNEIYRRYLILREHQPDKSLFALVSQVVCEPAPKFYLASRTMGEIYYRILRGYYDKSCKPPARACSLEICSCATDSHMK